MSFRGGRGGGRGGRGGYGGQRRIGSDEFKPFELYPEIELPSLPSISAEERDLIIKKAKLDRFWKNSCYYLQPEDSKSSNKDAEIERYSDRFKKSTKTKREDFESYLKLSSSNFPAELIEGLKPVQHDKKKLRWDQDSGEQILEHYAKLEEKFKGKEGKDKEKKGEDDKNDDEEEEQVEEESSDEDDYNQNIDFDDDEDDFNMEEEIDEDCYE